MVANDSGSCSGGTASFAVTLVESNDPDLGDITKDGWNHFMVRQGDPEAGPTTVSGRFSVRYTP